mmetsp:Transcript_277/g.1191  ORF Transcript_277/g.1191 Transcript_277/m.1191 type:complete len:825 (+) Transcript_277:171-2645(+)
MASAMDWLGVGSACSPAQDADDDDDDPRRRPRRNSPQETPHSEVRRGPLRGLDDHDGWSDEDEDSDGPNRNRSGRDGRSEFASSQEDSDYARGLSYSESEGEGARSNGKAGASKWQAASQTLGAVATLKSSLKSPSAVRREQKKATFAVIEDEERHVLDDPVMKHRLTGNNAGSWSGAGAGDEAAAKGSPDGQVCGVNVVILPSAWYVLYWDVFMMMLLFAIIFLLPYEAAFVTSYTDLSTSEMSNTQFTFLVVNRVLDAFFIMDFFLQFVLGYVDEQSGKVVTSLTQIRNRYLRSYFVIDVVSLFPFDQVVQSSSTPLLRAIKFLRMLKLLRALKANRIISRLLSHVDVSHAMIKIMKDIVILLILIHFLVCAWAYQANSDHNDDPDRWIYLNSVDISSANAMYITVMQLIFTSDIQVALLGDQQLKIFTSVVIYVLTALTIAELTDMVQNASAGDAAFQRMLDELNSLMRERNFPSDLRFRLRDFLRFKHAREKDMVSNPERVEMMRALSPQLQVQVTDQLSQAGMKSSPLFQGCKPDLLMKITMAASSMLLGATEAVSREGEPADHLCVLEKGFLISAGRVVMTGSIFGQECLLSGAFEEIKNVHSTHTLTFASMTRIHVHQLDQIVRKADPAFWRIMRTRAVRFLVGRGLLMYCQLAQRRRERGMKATNALAREMISLGVGKIVIYKMMLAYRYVNGEAEQIEYAVRKIQSWFRGVRVRKAFRSVVFRARMTNAYVPRELRNSTRGVHQTGSYTTKHEISRLITTFAPQGSEGNEEKIELIVHQSEATAQQIRALILEQRRMARTVDTIAMLIRKMTLGL